MASSGAVAPRRCLTGPVARPDAPVAVLVGSRTASSGEAAALRFIGRPGARTVGQPTDGFTTGNSDYGLADGARLLFPTGRIRDRLGL